VTVADLTPADELGLLIELAETQFGISSPADYEWQVDRVSTHPGESRTLEQLLTLESKGYVKMTIERRDDTHKEWVYAKITAAGQKRISELYAAGVEPSADLIELSFDESGLPPPPGSSGESPP
jgi:hypothetical protein